MWQVLLKSPRLFQITSNTLDTERFLRFVQITSKTKHKGFSKFFQTTSETYARCPRDSLKLHTSKTKHKISPRFFQIMYFKNKIRPPRDSFKHFKNQIQRPLKLLQKQNTRDPQDAFKLFQKEGKGCSRFFQIISKRKQEIPEIVSN